MAFFNEENYTKTLLRNAEDQFVKYNTTEENIGPHNLFHTIISSVLQYYLLHPEHQKYFDNCFQFFFLLALCVYCRRRSSFYFYSFYLFNYGKQRITYFLKLQTPIHYLAKKDSNSLLEDMISSYKDINIKDYYGRTPLHISAENGNTSFAKLLLKRGVLINVKTDMGKTALQISAEKGHKDYVDLLLQWKADVNEYDVYGKTALHMCIEKGHVETADLFLEAGAKVNMVDCEGRTALHYAVYRGSKKLVLSIVRKGAPVNWKDNRGNTALHYCARDGDNAIVAILLKAGASANIRDNNGKTALHYAAYHGHNETVLTLVKVTDFIDTGDNFNKTALHDGSQGGYAKVVKTLLEAGASVDVRDQFGKTPLHHSAEMNRADVIGTLIQNGANIGSTDAFGLTALDMAIVKSNNDAVAVLRRHSTQSSHLDLDKSETHSRFDPTIAEHSRCSQFSKPSKPGFIKISTSTRTKEGKDLNLETPGKVNSRSRASKLEDMRKTALLDTERVTMPRTRSYTTVETEPIYYNNSTTRSNTYKHVSPTGINPGKTTTPNKKRIDVNVPATPTLKSFTVYRSTASTAPNIRNHRKHVTDFKKTLIDTGTSLTQMVATPLENTTPTTGTIPTTTSTTTATSITTTNTTPATENTPTTATVTTTDISPTSDITPITAPTTNTTPTSDTKITINTATSTDIATTTDIKPTTETKTTKLNTNTATTTDISPTSDIKPTTDTKTTSDTTLSTDTSPTTDTATTTDISPTTDIKPITAPTIDTTPTTDTTLVRDSISAIDTIPNTYKIQDTVSRPISYTKQNSDLTLTTDRTKFANATPISSESTTKTLCSDAVTSNDTAIVTATTAQTNNASGTHLQTSENVSSRTNSTRMKKAPGNSNPPHLQENFTQTKLEMFEENRQTFFEKHEEMLDDADSGQEHKVKMNDKRNALVHRAKTCTRSIVKRKKRKGAKIINYIKKYTSYNIGQMNINNVDYLTTNGNQNFFFRNS